MNDQAATATTQPSLVGTFKPPYGNVLDGSRVKVTYPDGRTAVGKFHTPPKGRHFPRVVLEHNSFQVRITAGFVVTPEPKTT